MANKKVLLGLTTTQRSDWRGKVKEIKEYNINEVALFLTGIGAEERRELYKLLRSTPFLVAHHIHLRGDIDEEEIDFLVNNFKTSFLNDHSENDKYARPGYPGKFAKMIYIENTEVVPSESELKNFGGLCVDFSHWEDFKLRKDMDYSKRLEGLCGLYKIGCCHISAVRKEPNKELSCQGVKEHSSHYLENLNELDYINGYLKYLPEVVSIELENSFREQLEVKKYLEKLISN